MFLTTAVALFAIRVEILLDPAESPMDNPLKGLVPYVGQAQSHFPCSMEFSYLPLDKLVVGKEKYNWAPIEALLEDIKSRGRQTVLRIYLEYPGNPSAIPSYLLADGLKTTKWQDGNTANITPDYADPRLGECLTNFIAAFGSKYDGDARLGFLTMGLLGSWGEWHTYPRSELFATKEVQAKTIEAFTTAFKKTPVLMRYPAGPSSDQSENVSKPVGYHDDSFAWATLDTGRPEDSWFFVPALKASGAVNKWKTQPIGGEIRPEAWGICFDQKTSNPAVQDFEQCVRATHVSWLMDSGMFREQSALNNNRVRQASKMVRLMGYDFIVSKVMVIRSSASIEVQIDVINQGVAPFYAPWPLQLRVMNSRNQEIFRTTNERGLRSIVAGDSEKRGFIIDRSGLKGDELKLQLSCINPMAGGRPVKFANKAQDQDSAGWLSLGSFRSR